MADIINNVNGMVQIIFERTTSDGLKFRDSLLFAQTAYDNMTPESIAVLQQAKFERWVAMVTGTAVDEPEPVDESAPVEEAMPTDESVPVDDPTVET